MTVASSSRLPHLVHQAAMSAIRNMPVLSRTTFNAYSRLVGRFVSETTARTYFGALIKGDVRDLVMKHIFYFGIWEPNNSRLIETILSPGDTFLDVGANIGYDSLLASTLVGDTGRVVAIEASPRIFAQLSGNVALNASRNIRLVNKAAASARGELTLYAGQSGNQGGTSTLPRAGQTAEAVIQAEPLDEILTSDELASVRLIKMDIEGPRSTS
jgi:FkbM family methyltransferase